MALAKPARSGRATGCANSKATATASAMTKKPTNELIERCRRIPIGPILKELGAASVPSGNGWRRMLCPFHEEKTPSASVNHALRRFRCHGCDTHGDAVAL